MVYEIFKAHIYIYIWNLKITSSNHGSIVHGEIKICLNALVINCHQFLLNIGNIRTSVNISIYYFPQKNGFVNSHHA